MGGLGATQTQLPRKVLTRMDNSKNFDEIRYLVENDVIGMNHYFSCSCNAKTWLVKIGMVRKMLQRTLDPILQIICSLLVELSNKPDDF
jgi:hypothetical protein